jgi:5'-3' exonuclease
MGIPSYFRHILKKYPALLKGADDTKPHKSDILLVDFNCLIYGCTRSPALPVYTSANQNEWEDALLREIKTYVVLLWKVAGCPKTVLLAVDGVVPMAKIRQQRLRRFKSVWLAQKEREAGIRSEHTWDTNAITPGTQFMERLTRALKELATARGSGWIVSGAEEPGEGEQKLMVWVRSQNDHVLKGKSITVYGLDADLIVLSLLHSALYPSSTWSILRESQEFGKISTTDKFSVLFIQQLLTIMFPQKVDKLRYIYDYIAGMTLLGNDFVPHSLGFTIRDSGHDRLVHMLHELHKGGKFLVDESQTLVKESLHSLLLSLSETEAVDIKNAFFKKYTMRTPPPRSDSERAMLPVQELPIVWAEENSMWNSQTNKLHETWAEAYYTNETPLSGEQDIHEKCIAYFTGLQWVINYYTGKPVSNTWMYPWTYPPLWRDLACASVSEMPLPYPEIDTSKALKPQEQLAMVLPYESWGLIRNATLRTLPGTVPSFWIPAKTFHSLGKRWLWECPPRIPILTQCRLYAVLDKSARSQSK